MMTLRSVAVLILALLFCAPAAFADTDPPEPAPLTPLSQTGGSNNAILAEPSGRYVYLGSGPRLLVVSLYPLPDLPPAASMIVDRSGILPGVVQSIALDEQTLYVLTDRSLTIYDATKPNELAQLGEWRDETRDCRDVEVIDGRAYVACAGLRVLDVTDPVQITEVGALAGETMYELTAAAPHLLYAGEGYRFVALDISDPAHPARVAQLAVPEHLFGIAARGRHAYTVAGNAGLRVIDVFPDGPTAAPRPVEIGQLPFPGAYLLDIATRGEMAYVAAGHTGMAEVSIADPGAPKLMRTLSTPSHATALALGPNPQSATVHVATQSHGMTSFSKLPFDMWMERIGPQLPGGCADIARAGKTLLCAGYTGGVTIYDAANPRAPAFIQRIWRKPAEHVVVDAKGRAYVTYGVHPSEIALRRFTLTDPRYPEEDATDTFPGQVRDIAAADTAVFVADSLGLRVRDYDTPARNADYALPELSAVTVEGGRAYLLVTANGGGSKVAILDASALPALTPLGEFPVADGARAIAVSGSTAYVAGRVLEVYSAADAGNAAKLGEEGLPAWGPRAQAGHPPSLAVRGSHVLITLPDEGLREYDFSDPAAPKLIAKGATPGVASALALGAGYVAVADGPGGLTLFPMAHRIALPVVQR